jgi:hypothetical protein
MTGVPDRVTETIGSPSGAAVASLVFGVVAVVIGVVVARLLRQFAASPGEASYVLTTPRARRWAGGLVTTGGLAIVWVWLWSGFYSVSIAGNAVELEYLLPTRHVRLPAGAIARTATVPKPKGARALEITLADGTRYASAAAAVPPDRLEAIRRRIDAAAGR